MIDKKDPLSQLEATKSSIKDLVIKLLSKSCLECKGAEMEFSPVYFNSTSKTVINHRFHFDKSFQVILYRIDNWVNEGPGWIVESIKPQFTNISAFGPFIGSSYIKLPVELRNSKKKTHQH